ncbi:TIM protein, partial [Asarcornis scutulata]|nr:TIM protein [Asarcornis scutulata]
EGLWAPPSGLSPPPVGLGCRGRILSEPPLSPGLAGPLWWLENCLRRTAGDREQEGERGQGSGLGTGARGWADSAPPPPGLSFPVPLVPLSEENEDAMEDRRFRALLRELGLRPPANEQESFWRIPATLTPQQLRRAAASLAHHSPNPEGLPQHPEELPVPPRHPQAPAPGEDLGWGLRDQAGGAGAALEPLSVCPAAEQPPAPLGLDSESEEPVPVPLQSGSKRRRRLNSEDEDGGSPGGLSPSDPISSGLPSWGFLP